MKLKILSTKLYPKINKLIIFLSKFDNYENTYNFHYNSSDKINV